MSIEKKYIPGYGNRHAKLVILIECPSLRDAQSGILFSDSKELDQLLQQAGIVKENCWLTAVSKFYIPPNEGMKRQSFQQRAEQVGVNLEQQLDELRVEINTIKPNCILAVGKNTLWALYGKYNISQHRGSILWSGIFGKFVPTYNPVGLSRSKSETEFIGYWNKQVILFDILRANKQSQFKEYILPTRLLQVAKNSQDLLSFYERYKDYPNVSVDIEAGGHCVPVCVGLAFSKSHGMTIPLWNEDGISKIPDSDLVNIWIILDDILRKHDIIGQNFNYDRDKLQRLGFTIRHLLSDTMLKAFAINPELPKGLAFNTSIFSEEPYYKDEGMYEGSYDDLMMGCARDACVTFEINDAMEADLIEIGQREYFYNFLMKLPDLYREIETTGFGINPTKRDELFQKYINWSENNNYELFKLIGHEVNIKSPKQVTELLFTELKLPVRNGTGEDELTSLLNLSTVKDERKRKIIELILESRRVEKTISTYLMALPDFDGRLKTTCYPCLETGRSKTGQQEPPIRPRVDVVGKGKKTDHKVMGIAFQTITKHGDVGADVRSMYVP